jgi:hypothetical protein
VCGAGIH